MKRLMCLGVLGAMMASCGTPVMVLAQEPAPALSSSEQIALASVSEKMSDLEKQRQGLMQALHAVEADFVREHPGYHIDERTGGIAKDAAKPMPAPKAQEPKK